MRPGPDSPGSALAPTDLHDVVLVGGGLQSCLAVLALAQARPDARVVLVERGPELCGNHTWCFHADDVPAALAAVIEPAVAHRWDGYDVAFPEHARTLTSAYAAATSASLAAAVRAAVAARPGFTILTGADAVAVSTHAVVLRDGRTLAAAAVIDARGPERLAIPAACGYQKFVGLELALTRPHGLTRPMLMDATVPQVDGFRFMYVLPFAPDRVLVEDTYFSDGPELAREALANGILAHAQTRGLAIRAVIREEHGVLPLPLELPPAPGALEDGPVLGGYQGGWFHPTTGYSFPIALRVASFIATELHGPDASRRWHDLIAEHRGQLAFALRLNRMLFRWFAPADRHHVLARFYRNPEPVVHRFYAMQTTGIDRARILIGKPPRGMNWRAAITGRSAAAAGPHANGGES